MIAGLEDITYGDLYINGEYANTLLPSARDCAMVFQSYALYPNMTVYDNMAFSLKVRHISKKIINEKVLEAAKILELTDYLGRKPSELSGGQRQRVALGRAIVRDAKVFLMDEPLSNLDAKLRVQMRTEIVALHKKINSTTIYVTHDQTEAMTMADRIVVMKDGYVQQIGTPKEIYNNPNNIFVATFIGTTTTNILKCHVKKNIAELANGLKIKLSTDKVEKYKESLINILRSIKENNAHLIKENNNLTNPDVVKNNKIYRRLSFRRRIPGIVAYNIELIKKNNSLIDQYQRYIETSEFDALLGIRPEDISTVASSQLIKHKSEPFKLNVSQAELLGNEYYLHSVIGEEKICSRASANEDITSDSEIECVIDEDKIHLFDIETQKNLLKRGIDTNSSTKSKDDENEEIEETKNWLEPKERKLFTKEDNSFTKVAKVFTLVESILGVMMVFPLILGLKVIREFHSYSFKEKLTWSIISMLFFSRIGGLLFLIDTLNKNDK